MSGSQQGARESSRESTAAARLGGRGRVLVCRCSHGSVYPESLSEQVLALLAEQGAEVVVTDDLCGLAARRDGRLVELLGSAPLTIAACHPRAVRWLLHRAGVGQSAEIELVSLRSSPPEEISAALSGRYGDEGGVGELRSHDAWVPWFPVIDYDRCTGCGQCASFCLFGVFTTGEDGKPVVSRPESCKTNCPACARVCPEVAIIFPKLAEAPVNGEEVREEQLVGAALKVDVDAMLGDDIYEALQQRRSKAKRRLLRKQALEQADAERRACSCSAGAQQGGLLTLQPAASAKRKDR